MVYSDAFCDQCSMTFRGGVGDGCAPPGTASAYGLSHMLFCENDLTCARAYARTKYNVPHAPSYTKGEVTML